MKYRPPSLWWLLIVIAALVALAPSSYAQFDFRTTGVATFQRIDIRGTNGIGTYPMDTFSPLNFGSIAYDYSTQQFLCSNNGGMWYRCFNTVAGGFLTVFGSGVTAFNARTGAVTFQPGDATAIQITATAPGNGITATDVQTGLNQLAARAFGQSSFNGRAGAVVPLTGDYTVGQVTGAAPTASPTLTGTPLSTTPATSDNSTRIATTAFVNLWGASASLPACATCETTNTDQTITGNKTLTGPTNAFQTSLTGTTIGSNPVVTMKNTVASKDISIKFTDTSATGYIDFFSNSFLFGTNGTNERMRIDGNGKVIIGRTSSTNGVFDVKTGATSGLYFYETGSNPAIQTTNGADPGASTTTLQINPLGGNVNFGADVGMNATPTVYGGRADLAVNGTTGGILSLQAAGVDRMRIFTTAAGVNTMDTLVGDLELNVVAGSKFLVRTNSGTERFRIASTGVLTITQPAATNVQHSFTGTTTGYHVVRFTNTTGDLAIGIDDSTGNGFGPSGLAAYSGIIDVVAAAPLVFATNNIARMTIASNGTLTVTAPAATELGHQVNGSTTAAQYFQMTSTGANFAFGIDSSVGGRMATGSTAYASTITTVNATPLMFGSNNVVRQIIDSSGNVGIGIAPTSKFHVLGSGILLSGTGFYNSLFVQDNVNQRGVLLGYDTSGQIGVIGPVGASSALAFWTHNGTTWGERMRIDPAGKVGIGGASSGDQLDINGAATGSLRLRGTGSSNATFKINLANNSNVIKWQLAGNVVGGDTFEINQGDGTNNRVMVNSTGVGIGQTPAVRLAVGAGSTGTNPEQVTIDSGSGAGGYSLLAFYRNGIGKGYVGIEGTSGSIITGSTANDMIIRNTQAIDYSVDAGASMAATLDTNGALTLKKTTGKYFERNRSFAMGEWTAFTPSMSASAGTVTACTDVGSAYTVIGKTMHVSLYVTGCSVSATPAHVDVTIPGSFTSARRVGAAFNYNDNGTAGNGFCRLSAAAGTTIEMYKDVKLAGTFATSTTASDFVCSIAFEIQ